MFTCNGTRSASLALCVSQARALVLAGNGPARVSSPAGDVLVWRAHDEWVVAINDMLPTVEQDQFRDKVGELLADHG